MGTAATATLLEANKHSRTSSNQMQKQVERGQAPKEVDRVDKPHTGNNVQQDHIHFKDGTALNADGTPSHCDISSLKLTNAILDWILKNGWKVP